MEAEEEEVYLDSNNYPEAPDIYYYEILYDEGEMQPIELYYYGGSYSILDSKYVEEIVKWMKSWK